MYIKDNEDCDILSSFYYSLDFISEGLANGSVLVYWCVFERLLNLSTYGRSRSAATVAGFLMSRKHFSFEDTISLLKEKRPQMSINHGRTACSFSHSDAQHFLSNSVASTNVIATFVSLFSCI